MKIVKLKNPTKEFINRRWVLLDKDEVENTHTIVKPSEYTWIERLVEEYELLKEKYIKLMVFIKTEPLTDMTDTEFRQLTRQCRIMEDYLDILEKRMSFKGITQ